MKKLSMLFALLGVVALVGGAYAVDNHAVAITGGGHGVTAPHPDTNPCPGSLYVQNADGSWENGYAWQYGGIVAPYYGAYAEGYTGLTGMTVCGLSAFTTQVGNYANASVDFYVWDASGTNPGNVLTVDAGAHVPSPAFWPSFTQNDIAMGPVALPGDGAFVGGWTNWPGQLGQWYWGADQNGFGGLPRTNIAPGIGYPTGWQDPGIIPNFFPCMAMGFGIYYTGHPVPVQSDTWGQIKNLYK